MKKRIILASLSPRRKEILGKLFKSFEVIPSNAEENQKESKSLSPRDEVIYLASLKARDIYNKNKDALVIGSDTVVSIDGEILGKPKDKDDARRMIKALSGRSHSVFTGVCYIADGIERVFAEETRVWVIEMTDSEIESYISGNEPYDKAGGYGVQGEFARFISSLEGDYFNVCGLPACRLYVKLREDFPEAFEE